MRHGSSAPLVGYHGAGRDAEDVRGVVPLLRKRTGDVLFGCGPGSLCPAYEEGLIDDALGDQTRHCVLVGFRLDLALHPHLDAGRLLDPTVGILPLFGAHLLVQGVRTSGNLGIDLRPGPEVRHGEHRALVDKSEQRVQVHEGTLLRNEDLDDPSHRSPLEEKIGQAVCALLVGSLGDPDHHGLRVHHQDVTALNVHIWVIHQALEDLHPAQGRMQLEDRLHKPGLQASDAVGGTSNNDPTSGHSEYGVAHEEEVHERRHIELQGSPGEAIDEMVHVQIPETKTPNVVLAPNSLEELLLRTLAKAADLRQKVLHVHHLRAPRLEESREVPVLRLHVDAVEALVDLHCVQGPRHHRIHLQPRLMHNHELETPALTIHRTDGSPIRLHLLLLLGPGRREELSYHATHGAAPQALDGGDRHCNDVIHAGLQGAALDRLQGAPTSLGDC
mmetsp:Transcript_58611/g.128697  ORF Transcript_58611/g.128697 Transcript_58611/m.128697 type:complete len:445 (+) Transcript_58611:166-1500(+)